MSEDSPSKTNENNTKSILIASAFHIGMLVLILLTAHFLKHAFGIGSGASFFVQGSIHWIWLGYIIMYLFLARNFWLAIPLLLFFAWTAHQNYSISQALNEGGTLELIMQGFGYTTGAAIALGAWFLKKGLTKKFSAKTSNSIAD